MRKDVQDVIDGLATSGYVADRALATTVHLALALEKPLLVEGAAGVGKTEIAKALASWLELDLIRLQCYEGLDVHTSLYEWNYQKQLLRIRLEGDGADHDEIEKTIYGSEYLLERPLLRAIRSDDRVVLLIDEVDRSDEEFEAFLLEILSDFQVSIPEVGTLRARSRPIVVLTSNGTRDLSDALRRRCLYLWIDYPDPEKELAILRGRFPELAPELASAAVRLVQRLRGERLSKRPGVAETLDFAAALSVIGAGALDREAVEATLGALIKDPADVLALDGETLDRLLSPDAGPAGNET
ncbi:MAG: MoxR family ATPase [Gemmatimonadota bacterium]|nr:MoxR family ATPase [Gemmatimonadota bacterium]